MRGEFIRGDGLVLPNNITIAGANRILSRALQNITTIQFHLGLGNAVFHPLLIVSETDEPVAGGYTRLPMDFSPAGWTLGNANSEAYAESAAYEFPAGAYGKAVTRLFIADRAIGAEGEAQVCMLSSPLPTPLLITPTTPEADRTFRYRLYLR